MARHKRAAVARWGALLFAASCWFGGTAGAQERRMSDYESELRNRISDRMEEFRRALRNERAPSNEPIALAAARARARLREKDSDDVRSERALDQPFHATVDIHDSKDGKGQDVEIRLTMPVDAFMEFAPIAALEAAAVPHKFPVVYIYLREERTDRVGRIAFRDAEPIAGRYLAGDARALDQMRDAIIWH